MALLDTSNDGLAAIACCSTLLVQLDDRCYRPLMIVGLLGLLLLNPMLNGEAASASCTKAFRGTTWRVTITRCGLPGLLFFIARVPGTATPGEIAGYSYAPACSMKSWPRLAVCSIACISFYCS